MRTPRTFMALGLIALLVPGVALGSEFNKTVPLIPNKLGNYTGEQIFEAAYQAYVCSFLMTVADQTEKGQFLRFYSVKLMQEDSVKTYGKGWNDVNFPGGLSAMTLSRQFAERNDISLTAAAGRLLTEDPQCKTLNVFSEAVLVRGRK